jgi:hypothetical protein
MDPEYGLEMSKRPETDVILDAEAGCWVSFIAV